MKLTDSAKFWLVFSFVLLAAFLGGILGNWVFIYILDKYYGVAAGNYLVNTPTQSMVVRDNRKPIVEQDSKIAQAVSSADKSLVRIFKKQTTGIYQPKDAVATAVIMTSDGWLMMASNLAANKAGDWSDYQAITFDRKIYSIEIVKTDPVSKVSFAHLKEAHNLLVSGLVSSQDLSVGQTLIAVNFSGGVDIARFSRDLTTTYSSDILFTKLVVSDFSGHDAYLFDTNGQLAGVSYNGSILATNGIEKTLEKLLTEGKIVYARLGINYLDLTKVFDSQARTGALIVSLDENHPGVIAGSPADKAGLKVGDVITAVDDTQLNEFNNLTLLMQDYSPNDSLVLSVRRGQENMKFTVKLDEIVVK